MVKQLEAETTKDKISNTYDMVSAFADTNNLVLGQEKLTKT